VSAAKKLFKSLLEWVQLIIISVILALAINLFVMQPIKVEGSSMYPTLHDKDFVIISRIGKTLNLSLDYGDIVVIDRRTDRKRSLLDDITEISIFHRFENRNLWIKRVIGKPGDIIEIKHGQVYRNGELLEEPYVLEDFMHGPNEQFIVPEDHIFVLGDNRNNSMDSRSIGYIPYDNIKGTLAFDISKLLR
jgi:signal peptidase I